MPIKIVNASGLQLTAKTAPNQPPPINPKEFPFEFDDEVEGKPRKIWVSQPFCDKITLVGEITAKAANNHAGQTGGGSLKALHSVMKEGLFAKDGSFHFTKPLKNYKSAKIIVGYRQASSVVGLSAKPGDAGFKVRMEFNPRRVTPAGLAELEDAWAELSLGLPLDVWLASARVGRLDIAVDLLGVHVTDLIVRHPKTWKQSAYYAQDGRLQTWSLLKKTGQSSGAAAPLVVAYDKRQERKEKGKPVKYGGTEHTRIEMRISNANKFLKHLAVMKNPLSALEVGSISQVAESHADATAWRSFTAQAYRFGLDAAEASAPGGHQLRKQFEAATASYWQPAKAWSAWLEHPTDSGMLGWVKRAQEAAKVA